MKKILALISASALLLVLCSCGGDISQTVVVPVESEIYTAAESDAAIKTVKKHFQKEFSGCTLKTLQYYGDERREGPTNFDGDEAIVITGDFYVSESGASPVWTPNQTYEGFSWILVRNNKGNWRYATCGYG